jgi:hypothetical protein
MIKIKSKELYCKEISSIPESSYFTGTVRGKYGLYLKADKGRLVSLTEPGKEMNDAKEVEGYKQVDPKHNVPKTEIVIRDIPVGTVFTGSLCAGTYDGVFLKCAEGGIVMLFGGYVNYSWGYWQEDVKVSNYKEIDLKLEIS